MHPLSPIIDRISNDNVEFPEFGLKIEKGINVIMPVYGLHYDPDYFPDPYKFDPERFSDENKKNIKPYTYIPFGSGPRGCIGKSYGVL
jgi:cytochrome P450 family 6